MMEIISHRGYWKSFEEKNQFVSFKRSFSLGFGTETDLRDCDGEIVISHDIPLKNSNIISIDEFFELYKSNNIESTLALNIKSDGLQEILKEKLLAYKIENYFVFDMSIPDTRGYIRNDIKFFVRLSEVENTLIYKELAKGVWLDAFEGLWYSPEYIFELLYQNLKIAIVSFELHRRDHISHWQWIKDHKIHLHHNIILCTDLPEEAKTFFFENEIDK